MRGTRTIALAGVSALALLTAACNGGGGSTASGSAGNTGNTAAAAGGEISIVGCTPQNPFIPAMTNETCGGDMLDEVLARLVHYNSETAAPEMDVAESIETTDNQNFTVKIKPGYKFSDGTEIKAKNFVDAWNWNRAGANGTLNSYFFDVIDGAADMDCGLSKDKDGNDAPDCEKKPAKTDKLSGLKVVDDHTFTIKTTEKVSNLPVRLGYSAFAPLPDSFFTDNGKAYGKMPIGAGPYKMESYDPATGAVLVKNPDYAGSFAGKVDKITFKIYQDQDAAYKDVQAGQTDLQVPLPVSALQGEAYKNDLPDRFAEKATGNIATISFPSPKADKSYENPKLRKAISMAIDRPSIIKAILANTREPATGWVSPVVDGYKANACGEACTYDAAKAKALFDESGGYKGTLTLGYNADGDHKGWTEAACNTIKSALGVDCKAVAYPDFATFRTLITDRKMKGMFRTGWQMDYPSIENFLAPLYGTGAGSNDGDYSSDKFDTLIKEAAAAPEAAAANAKYQEAEAVLGEDFPTIPMWYGKAIAGWSDKVENVKITPFGTIDLASVTVKS
ncbi:ABC transporter substrate-binding protein [Nostocoides vanveenii]|uniref:ABC transporter substrate-binding protein n=1 Tax=Nostocoides vanveenii TaxID=330835 RepID=A0ABP4WX84_9MICO